MNGLPRYEDADIHICGMCRAQFSDVEVFIQHKKHKCPVRLARQQETQGDDARNLKSAHIQTVPVAFQSVQDAPVPFPSVQDTSVPFPSVPDAPVPFQSVQDAPVPYQNEEYSQSVLPVMDNSPIQGSVSDKVSVQLSEDGSTIGYYPVTHNESPDAGIAPIAQHQYVILPCPEDDQVICSPHDQTDSQIYSHTDSQTDSQIYSQTDSQTYSQTDSQTYPRPKSNTDSQIYPQTDSQTYPQTDSQTYPQTDSQTYPQTESQTYSQTDSQIYSTLETVYTLNSHTIHQSTDQVQTSIQTEQPINYYKRNVAVESGIYISEPFQETDNTRIEDQSTDCIINDSSQEPVCNNTTGENLQPVNYSKNNLLQDENSAVINLLQTDQPVVIQNLNNLNLQQTGIPVDRLNGTLQSEFDESKKQSMSILREHLIGAEYKMVVKTATPKVGVKNVQITKLPPTSQTKDGMMWTRTLPKPHNKPAKFQYTINNIDKAPKPSPAKKPNKTPLEKKFRCKFDNCLYKTAYLKDLERHSRTHTGDKPYKCTRCKKAFSRTDKLTLHMRYHLDDRVFKCNFCNYSAVENGSLKKHMKMHLDERPYSCQVCTYKSRSSSQLQIHLRIHTGDRPYGCKICEAVFKVSSDLHRHVRIHTGEKPFRCEIENCSYTCAVKSNLKSHYQTHHSEVLEHKCTTCDFATSSRRALFEHRKTHESIPELTCSICEYQCSNKSALRNHLRIHSDADPFECTYCEYKAVQLGNVQAHMVRKHPNMIPKKLNRKRWSKINKNQISIKMKDIAADAENTETKRSVKKSKLQPKCLQNFKCDRCPAAFVREDSLKCHLKQHHDSSLSTAYTVLKLQQPVINTPNSQPPNLESAAAVSVSEHSNRDVSTDKRNSIVPENQALHLQETRENLATVQGQAISGQSQLIPSQSVTLGINDILMAAGMSGLSSAGNSPTSKLQTTGDIVAQDLSLNSGAGETSDADSSETVQSPGNQGLTTAVIGQSQNDVPAVQVMQNISLPYIRLPNGQVLILTGQTSMNQIITQPDGPIQSDSGLIPNAVDMHSHAQLLSQPIDTQQQIVQCAADSTVTTPPPQISAPQSQGTILTQPGAITAQDGALTQQQGAIPIQIILPSDSQQAVPIVSQLLNSVMNRSSSEGGQNQGSVMLQGIDSVSDHVQNFVLQIPTQSGMSRDSSGNLNESQSFVLQIPGSSSFN